MENSNEEDFTDNEEFTEDDSNDSEEFDYDIDFITSSSSDDEDNNDLQISLLDKIKQIEEDEKFAMNLFKEENDRQLLATNLKTKIEPSIFSKDEENYYIPRYKNSGKKDIIRCIGITKNGNPCSTRIRSINGFCCKSHRVEYIHRNEQILKELVLIVLIRNIPDKNIRKIIFTSIFNKFDTEYFSY